MKYWILPAFCLLCLATFNSLKSGEIILRKDTSSRTIESSRADYSKNLSELEKTRIAFKDRWKTASAEEQREITIDARQLILTAFYQQVFPAWFETEWNFHGTTQTPGKGTIACGYFVTTCLKQVGFNCDRVKLAQQASQKIIRTFVDSKQDIHISSDLPIDVFLERIRKSGEGLYIVGLDTHTGFLAWDGETMAFIHSSYYRPPFSVTSEEADSKNPLKDSRYRMVGKILGDEMIRKWITGEPFPMTP